MVRMTIYQNKLIIRERMRIEEAFNKCCLLWRCHWTENFWNACAWL